MIRLFVIIGGLIALALLTLFIAPFFIDWGQYRHEFEQQASKIIGHKVSVNGKAEARILPFPSLTFNDVIVEGENTDTPLLNIKKFAIFAEISPLLSGELHIIDMVLENPVAHGVLDKNQQLNWLKRNENILPFNVHMDDVVLKNITIKDGSIVLHNNANDLDHHLQNINASLSAKSLLGPWRSEGSFSYQGKTYAEAFDFKFDTGTWSSAKQHMRLRTSLLPKNYPYHFKTVGLVDKNQPQIHYKGNFQINPLETQALKDFKKIKPEATTLPIHVNGDFIFKADEFISPNFDLDIATKKEPYRINGTGNLNINQTPSFKIIAEGRQVDVNRLGAPATDKEQKSGQTKGQTHALSEHLINLQSFLRQIPQAPIVGEISLNLPAVTAGENIIRNIAIDFSQLSTGWQISNFAAELPGRTNVQAIGTLNFKDRFSFIGSLVAASNQPTGLASWLKGSINSNIRPIKRAGFLATVSLNEEEMKFEDLELDIDGQSLMGDVLRTAPKKDNSRPQLQANLKGDVLNINHMLALMSLLTKESDGQNILDHDIALKLDNDILSFDGFKASKVKADLALSNKSMDIKTFQIENFEGATLDIAGQIDEIFTSPDGQLNAEIKAQNAHGVLKFLNQQFSEEQATTPLPLIGPLLENSGLTEKTHLKLQFEANSDAENSNLALTMDGTMAGTKINSKFLFNGDVAKPYEAKVDLNANFHQAQPYVLLQQLGLNALPIDLNLPITFDLKAQGIANQVVKTTAKINLDDSHLSFNGQLSYPNQPSPKMEGEMVFSAQSMEDITLLSGWGVHEFNLLELNQNEVTKAVELNAQIMGSTKKFNLNSIEGAIYNNKIAGSLAFDLSNNIKNTITGQLNLDQVSLPILSNLVFTNTHDGLEEDTHSAHPLHVIKDQRQWSQKPFGTPLLQSFDGIITLKARDLIIATDQIAKDFNAELELSKGDIHLKTAKTIWQEQPISFDLALKNTHQNGTLTFGLKMDGFLISKLLWLNQTLNLPVTEAIADIALNVQASGKNPLEMVKGLSGTAQINLQKAQINHLNSAILSDILPVIDDDNFEIKLDAVTALVKENLFTKPSQFHSKPIEFTIAGGIARTSDIALFNTNSKLLGEAKFDLVQNNIFGSANFNLHHNDEILKAASPSIGFTLSGNIANPDLNIDASSLNNFLALRAFEQQRHKIEALQAEIIEKQRLNRAVLKVVTKAERRREIERKRREEEARRLEEEQLRKAEEEAVKLKQSETVEPKEDFNEIRRKKLKELQLKHEKDILNRDGITIEELEQIGNN